MHSLFPVRYTHSWIHKCIQFFECFTFYCSICVCVCFIYFFIFRFQWIFFSVAQKQIRTFQGSLSIDYCIYLNNKWHHITVQWNGIVAYVYVCVYIVWNSRYMPFLWSTFSFCVKTKFILWIFITFDPKKFSEIICHSAECYQLKNEFNEITKNKCYILSLAYQLQVWSEFISICFQAHSYEDVRVLNFSCDTRVNFPSQSSHISIYDLIRIAFACKNVIVVHSWFIFSFVQCFQWHTIQYHNK